MTCSATEKRCYELIRMAMAERRKALELLGYAPHCVGLAAKGRASAQKSAAQKSKCIEKQGH